MINYIDSMLNRITMYRLMLYFLFALVGLATLFGLFGLFPYSPTGIVITALTLLVACWVFNNLFAKLFRVPVNVESMYITALILALIITPVEPSVFFPSLPFLLLLCALAMGAKYILAWRGKHVFNPAAIAVVATFYTMSQGASWWIGDWPMTLVILLGGLLVARKLQRFDLVWTFLAVALGSILLTTSTINIWDNLYLQVFRSPLLFFAFIMLTEPLTTPPTRNLRIAYAALVGIMYVPGFHVGDFYFTAELALVVGNIFSYLVSPKARHRLTFKSRQKIAGETYEYIFAPNYRLAFEPGQYMEWTVGHAKPDSRGNRRYFTIASSPTEDEIKLGLKFYDQPSSFKRALNSLQPGDKILSGQLAGEFILPQNLNQKLAFIAGGIGITPFRSMVKYLLDKNQKRDIILIYANNTEPEIAYKEIFDAADQQLGLKTVYAITQISGHINAEAIRKEIPDFAERIFYISGPRGMVVAFEKTLKNMGVSSRHIKIDFFPGYV